MPSATASMKRTKNTSANSRLNSVVRANEEFERNDLMPQVVNEQQMIANDKSEYNVHGQHVGHFLEPSSNDEDFKLRKQMANNATWQKMKDIRQEDIEKVREMKEKQEYMATLRFAEFYIDPKDPRTQEEAYEIFPELLEVPTDHYLDWIGKSMALHQMLKRGYPRGKEDFMIVYKVTRPEYVIPTGPAMDPHNVLGLVDGDSDLKGNKGIYTGLFNPRRWGLNDNKNWNGGLSSGSVQGQYNLPGLSPKQLTFKVMLLKRLFPGCRNMKNEDIIKKIIAPVNPLKPLGGDFISNTSDDVFNNREGDNAFNF